MVDRVIVEGNLPGGETFRFNLDGISTYDQMQRLIDLTGSMAAKLNRNDPEEQKRLNTLISGNKAQQTYTSTLTGTTGSLNDFGDSLDNIRSTGALLKGDFRGLAGTLRSVNNPLVMLGSAASSMVGALMGYAESLRPALQRGIGGAVMDFAIYAKSSGMSMDSFTKALITTEGAFGMLGATQNEAAKNFSGLINSVRKTTAEFGNLGMSNEDLAKFTAEQLKIAVQQGVRGKQAQDRVIMMSKELGAQFQELAQRTGKSTADLAAMATKLVQDATVSNFIATLKNGGDDVSKAMQTFGSSMGALFGKQGEELANVAAQTAVSKVPLAIDKLGEGLIRVMPNYANELEIMARKAAAGYEPTETDRQRLKAVFEEEYERRQKNIQFLKYSGDAEAAAAAQRVEHMYQASRQYDTAETKQRQKEASAAQEFNAQVNQLTATLHQLMVPLLQMLNAVDWNVMFDVLNGFASTVKTITETVLGPIANVIEGTGAGKVVGALLALVTVAGVVGTAFLVLRNAALAVAGVFKLLTRSGVGRPPGVPPVPGTPGAPIPPGTPGGPIPPSTPGAPIPPGKPGGPIPPGTPGGPIPPGTPGSPIPPGTPGSPIPPGTPGGPIPPGTPGGPIPPGTPGSPIPPGTPGGPIPPGTPGTATPKPAGGNPTGGMAELTRREQELAIARAEEQQRLLKEQLKEQEKLKVSSAELYEKYRKPDSPIPPSTPVSPIPPGTPGTATPKPAGGNPTGGMGELARREQELAIARAEEQQRLLKEQLKEQEKLKARSAELYEKYRKEGLTATEAKRRADAHAAYQPNRTVREHYDAAKETAKDKIAAAKNSETAGRIKSFIKDWGPAIGLMMAGYAGSKIAESGEKKLEEDPENIMGKLQVGAGETLDFIGTWGSSILFTTQIMKEYFPDALSKVKDFGGGMMSMAKDTFPKTVSKLTEFGSSLGSWSKTMMNSPLLGKLGSAAATVGIAAAGGFVIDAGLGAMGVGKEDVTEKEKKQDDINWDNMNWWQKAESGAARTVENIGKLFGLGNLVTEAEKARIRDETEYFSKKELEDTSNNATNQRAKENKEQLEEMKKMNQHLEELNNRTNVNTGVQVRNVMSAEDQVRLMRAMSLKPN